MNALDWIKLCFGVIGFFATLWLIAYLVSHGITLGIGRAKGRLRKEGN